MLLCGVDDDDRATARTQKSYYMENGKKNP